MYGIVKQNGGTITVFSEIGVGTTFTIYFPCAGPLEYNPAVIKISSEKMTGTEAILIVEDEEIVRQFVARTLYENGYAILTAGSYLEAKKIMMEHANPIDLLITDVVLPQTNGKEAAENLMQLQPSLKVIFMSGYTDSAIVHHSIIDEKVNFLQKPFTTDVLLAKVRDILDTKET